MRTAAVHGLCHHTGRLRQGAVCYAHKVGPVFPLPPFWFIGQFPVMTNFARRTSTASAVNCRSVSKLPGGPFMWAHCYRRWVEQIIKSIVSYRQQLQAARLVTLLLTSLFLSPLTIGGTLDTLNGTNLHCSMSPRCIRSEGCLPNPLAACKHCFCGTSGRSFYYYARIMPAIYALVVCGGQPGDASALVPTTRRILDSQTTFYPVGTGACFHIPVYMDPTAGCVVSQLQGNESRLYDAPCITGLNSCV